MAFQSFLLVHVLHNEHVLEGVHMFRRTLAAAAAALIISASQAAHIATHGVGQALIYPYYSVRSGTASVFVVFNHTDRAKALKVRFIESKASKETLDFNLYVSPFDVWSAVVTSDTAGGARVITNDKSCTTPRIAPEGQRMFDFAYANDAIGNDVARQREGYVEIIEMADLAPGGSIEAAVTHNSEGVPANCALLRSDAIIPQLRIGSGGLSGIGYLLNATDGTSFGYNAIAIDNFAKHHPVWFEPGSIDPNLSHANPKVSQVFDAKAGLVITDWSSVTNAAPVDPVTAAMTVGSLWNYYNTDGSVLGQTSWIINFPTKAYYFRGNDPIKLFDQPLTSAGSCVQAEMSTFDSEEREHTANGASDLRLCWEASPLNHSIMNVVPTALAVQKTSPFSGGQVNVSFTSRYALRSDGATSTVVAPDGTVSTRKDVVYVGLPVVGFAAVRLGTSRIPYPQLYPHRGVVDLR
jgi:hypothetical protein